MSDVGTFKTLSEEELKKAAASAEEALAKQRHGIDTPGPVKDNAKGSKGTDEIRLEPKDGPTTRGVSWGEERQ